jgi:hypothetical protein
LRVLIKVEKRAIVDELQTRALETLGTRSSSQQANREIIERSAVLGSSLIENRYGIQKTEVVGT